MSFKVGDRVRLVGEKWKKAAESDEHFPTEGTEVVITDFNGLHAGFSYKEMRFIIYGSWGAELVESYISNSDLIIETFTFPQREWNDLLRNEKENVARLKEQVENKIKRTYTSWPWNKEVACRFDSSNRQLHFFWKEME